MATSLRGLFQFSTENAYKVRTLIPNSADPSITSRTALMPARCPATRGKPRFRAHRPLPSMMMAICSGKVVWSICCRRSIPLDLTMQAIQVCNTKFFTVVHLCVLFLHSTNIPR